MSYFYDVYNNYFYPWKEPINGNMERRNEPLKAQDDLQSIQVDDQGYHSFVHSLVGNPLVRWYGWSSPGWSK